MNVEKLNDLTSKELLEIYSKLNEYIEYLDNLKTKLGENND